MSNIPVNTKTLEESLTLSEEILTAIELETTSLSSCMLKASRLARLLNDFDYQQIFMYENGGYPTNFSDMNDKIKVIRNKMNRGVEEEGLSVENKEKQLAIWQGQTNSFLKLIATADIENCNNFLAARKSFLHEYVSNKYYELKYAKISTDIFSRTRLIVDENIGKIVPDAMKQFASVYENLTSENTEDWSNAVHSCRRILQNTADALYPAQDDKLIKLPNGKEKTIKLGVENYINRLIAYVEEHSESESFEKIVGSNIRYLVERLHAIYNAANKGTHDTITTKEEADRYVIYTYLIIGDILSLMKEDPEASLLNDTEISS